MLQTIKTNHTVKDITSADKKQRRAKWFNQWFSRIGQALNTAQLSNHK